MSDVSDAVAEVSRSETDRETPALRAGAGQLGLSKGFQLVFRILTSLVLARLLEPRDFGLLGLVGVVMVLLQRTVGDGGTMSALVQREHLSSRLASTVFWFNAAMGIATTAALVVLAPVVGSALGDPGATDVLRGLAITFTLMGIAKVPQAMLRREMRYRAIAGLDTINALVTGIVAVPLAATGHGVASLVVGQVVAVGVEVVLTVVTVRWWPTSGFHRSELRKISGFARNLFAFNLVSYFADAGDKFIVGRFVGTASLGIYNLPYRLLLSPVFAVGQVVRELLLPVFSRNQHDNDAIARVYLRAISMLALVSFPATALTAALGGPLVDTALGPKWQEAGPILTVLAVVALELSVLVTSGVILRAKGRTDILFRWGVVAGATNFVCYAIGAQWGVMGVAAAFLFGTTILAYPAMAIPFRQIDLPMARLGQVLLAPSLVAAATAGAAAATRVAAESAGMAPIAVLVVGTLAGASALLVSLLILRPPALADLLANVTRRRRR